MICYFWGLTRIESSMAAMIISVSPLLVLSMLALRGERFTYRHIIRVALALVGVYLLIGPGGRSKRHLEAFRQVEARRKTRHGIPVVRLHLAHGVVHCRCEQVFQHFLAL